MSNTKRRTSINRRMVFCSDVCISSLTPRCLCSLQRAFNMGFYFISTALTSFVAFLAYELSGHTLTAEKVFSTIALFSALRLSAATFFPS